MKEIMENQQTLINNQGWIKLHRSLLNNPISKKPMIAWFFIYCLLKANHCDQKIIWNKKEIVISRGSFVSGLKTMSEESGISIQSIRTALVTLKSTNTLTIKTTTKFSIITILNYDKYQEPTNKLTNNQQTTNKQLTTNNNIKNNNNNNKISSKEDIQDVEVKVSSYGNQKVNLIIKFFTLYKKYSPTDRKPRNWAFNLARKIDKFLSEYKEDLLVLEHNFDSILEKYFNWLKNQDYFEKIEKLEIVFRKFDVFKSKYIPALIQNANLERRLQEEKRLKEEERKKKEEEYEKIRIKEIEKEIRQLKEEETKTIKQELLSFIKERISQLQVELNQIYGKHSVA